jgi:hypothetical protein
MSCLIDVVPLSMETSELLTQLTQALTEAAHAHEVYERALARLRPLEAAYKEAMIS